MIFALDVADKGVDPFGKANMGNADEQRYYRYCVARFGAFANVWWDLINEWHLCRDEAWVNQMVALVKEWDPYDHTMSVHGTGRFPFGQSPWVDFVMFQSWDEHGAMTSCSRQGDTEIWNNRFLNTKTAPNEHYYGVKGREARRCRIHHNTIEAGFSIELPFEGDEDVEIDHNILLYAVSIPKYAGGHIPKSGRTFHIHHNYFRDSYSIEFVRNCVEIDHNLFDFDVQQDGGNLISAFGDVAAPGPASFHNNLVSNPGRGVMWMNEPYGKLEVRNNHIIARTTKEPRTEGLFGFNEQSGFAEFRFTDNIIECEGTPRPLFRNDASGAASWRTTSS